MRDLAIFQRIGSRHDMDGIDKKLSRDAGFLLVLAEAEEAEPGNYND